jgi:hypothetical protein
MTLPIYTPENAMGKNAMAGAVTLCGVGLCMIGGALLMQSGGQAHAAGGVMPAAAALASAANAQAGPTVVWYGVGSPAAGLVSTYSYTDRLYRAWSDGRVEMKKISFGQGGACDALVSCATGWITVSTPTQGYRAAADINADELVDGADLASVLSNWGDAPRVPFPPSDCPLNLINP